MSAPRSSDSNEETHMPGGRATSKRPLTKPRYLSEESEEAEGPVYKHRVRSKRLRPLLSLFIPEEEDSSEPFELPVNILNRIIDGIDFTRRATLSPANPDRAPSPQSIMDGLERVRILKRRIAENISILQPQGKKAKTRYTPQEDQENILIKTLRDDEKMKWGDITDKLNAARLERGEAADLTDRKLYGRYLQARTRVALEACEIGFKAEDYKILRNPQQLVETSSGLEISSKNGKKRIKSFANPKELETNLRPVVGKERAAELATPDMTEQLMRAVAKVERNFWVLVADEMELATTTLYDPDMLAERYHSI